MSKVLVVTMQDGSEWAVPVDVLALSHAVYYAQYYGDDIDKAFREETLPAFNAGSYEVIEWAQGIVLWDDVKRLAVEISPPTTVDYASGWINGKMEIRDV